MKTLEQSTMKAEKTTTANKVSQTKQQLWDRNTDSWKMGREWEPAEKTEKNAGQSGKSDIPETQ